MDDMYHNCRWCKHNNGNSCDVLNKFVGVVDNPYKLAEEGYLAGAIEEAINFPRMDKVEELLSDYGISEKRKREIINTIEGELEASKVGMVELIDDSVSRVIVDNSVDSELEIVGDPESFYCKHFE